jgi:hypothetical protein
LDDGFLLAHYRRKELLYAKFGGSELKVDKPLEIAGYPDNISRSPLGYLTVAAQQSWWKSFYETIFTPI